MTAFLMIMVAILALQLFSRGVIGYSFTWIPELSGILFIWMVFIGSYVLFFDHEHIYVDFINTYLTPSQQRMLNIIKYVLILAVMLVIIYGSYFRMVNKFYESSLTMPFIKIGYIYLSIFVGFLLQAILTLYRIVEEIKSSRQ
jgi:TRAP-type C4-dicarboxylate transport system permease small subunit